MGQPSTDIKNYKTGQGRVARSQDKSLRSSSDIRVANVIVELCSRLLRRQSMLKRKPHQTAADSPSGLGPNVLTSPAIPLLSC
jgi:hypothetical protein